MAMPETSPVLRQTILQVVENQLRDNDPPETRQTLDRLMGEGCVAKEARRLIATAITIEVFHIGHDREPFSPERYRWNLARLPRDLYDEDGKELYGRSEGRQVGNR
ncbi:MAG: hypothetical protein WD042_00100 [Phycisphaeraceae bacterium]